MRKLTSLLLILCLLLSLTGLSACRLTKPSQAVPSGTADTAGEQDSLYETQIPLELVTDEPGDTAETDPVTFESTDTQQAQTEPPSSESEETVPEETAIDENGTYDDKESVALYIHTYGKLPSNYITKSEASALGWTGGSVEQFVKGKAIGGDRFGNYEGQLPKAKGRTYYECDIDTIGKKSRGAKRIIYSNDGLIYYTEDHYETFELLYTSEGKN